MMGLYTFQPALNLAGPQQRFAHLTMVEKLEIVALLKHTLLTQPAVKDPASTLIGYTRKYAML